MPFVTAPNLIEQSDFTKGWAPDPEVVSLEPEYLLDTKNLLPDPVSGSLVTRRGFKRLASEFVDLSGHRVQQLYSFHSRFSGSRHDYIIAIVSTGASATDNVRLYALNVTDPTSVSVTRMDTAGVNWANPKSLHWGMSIQGKWYGGVKGEPMYSWDPSGPTWDDEAGVKATWLDWVNDDGASVDYPASEYPKDYAWKGSERVLKGGDYYSPRKSIRYDTWESGERYSKGQRVSRKDDYGAVEYWVSFKCVTDHTADSSNKPGDGDGGGSWTTYWDKVRLASPTNDDSDVADDWDLVPVAAETSVAEWHANRLWLRYDGSGEQDRVQFSAPTKNKHGQDIATLEFDATDFVPGNDANGPGGGWINFNHGSKTGVVTALKSFGQYLVVWKRQATWVLTGFSEATFNVRQLAGGIGTFSKESVAEHDGLLYFASEDGLYVTDGTTVEPVEGMDVIRDWWTARVGPIFTNADETQYPRCWEWGPYIFTSFNGYADDNYVTVAYHPETASFWYTNLPVRDVTKSFQNKTEQLFFCTDPNYGDGSLLVQQYDHATAADTDDSGNETAGTASEIAWHVRTGWWPFGLLREQRRIRRVWAVVKGVAQTFTLVAYRDWVESAAETTTLASTTTTPQHMEGEWFADSHAVSFKLSGTKGAAVVYGIAVDTEPRRHRYHS